jgi:hypothetical protein
VSEKSKVKVLPASERLIKYNLGRFNFWFPPQKEFIRHSLAFILEFWFGKPYAVAC